MTGGIKHIIKKNIYCIHPTNLGLWVLRVYKPAANPSLLELNRTQAEALCIYRGAFWTSPIPALQVETGEMPLNLRQIQWSLSYWLNLQGHEDNHLTKPVLKECWEYGHTQAKQAGISNIPLCKTIVRSVIPSWLFSFPNVNMEAKEIAKS